MTITWIRKHLRSFPFGARQRKAAHAREPMTEAAFVLRISEAGGDGIAAASIWRRLQEWIDVEGFTPHPTDRFGRMFGIAEEDRDEDLILDLLKELDLPVPDAAFLEQFGEVETPLRLAQMVATIRKASSSQVTT